MSDIAPLEDLQSTGLRWLAEMELVDNPVLLNALVLNLMRVRGIRHVEFLLDKERKRLLIYVVLGWWGRRFARAKIHQQIAELIIDALPSFAFRITFDQAIFLKAQELFTKCRKNM